MPEINEVLHQSRYRIVNHLGQNGTGMLYRAYDNMHSSEVLLREIPIKTKVGSPAQIESLKIAFADEAKELSALDHGSVMQVRDYFSDIDRHYLVMELTDGDYLSDLLEKTKTAFSMQELTAWADQLLEALVYLHAQSPPVIHRDLRPQNVKLTSDGKIKLLALGAAKINDNKTNSIIANQSFDSNTLNYQPLEQIWSKLDLASQKVIANSYSETSVDILMQPADGRSDVYSLAATLYHLVTARRPVDALERSIEILEGNADPLPIPSKLNANIPPEISYVLMKALDLKRENRFDSAMMMRQVLRTAITRVKEREAKEGKQAEVPAPMVPLAEQRQAEVVDKAIHTTADAEADLNRQMEQMQKRLREAEAQQLKAEQRAADAEKRLREAQAHDVVAYGAVDDVQVLDIPLASPAPSSRKPAREEVVQVLDIPLTPAPVVDKKPKYEPKKEAVAAKPEKEFEFAFAEEPKSGGMGKMLALAAVVLVLVGGGIGIWAMMGMQSAQKPAAPVQSITTEPKNETAPLTARPEEPTQENAGQTPSDAQKPGVENASQTPVQSASQPERKPATQIAAQKEKEKKPEPAKPAAPAQKKPVTVDDLINDN